MYLELLFYFIHIYANSLISDLALLTQKNSEYDPGKPRAQGFSKGLTYSIVKK